MNDSLDKYPISITETRTVKRITVKQTIADILRAFNLERGLIFTIKKLFLNPGELVRSYLVDGRFRIFNSFRLLVLTTAASLLVIYLSDFGDFFVGLEAGLNEENENAKTATELVQEVYFDWYNLFLWIAIPIYGLCSFLFFQEFRYNFAEHMVLQTFYLCAVNIISFIVFPSSFLLTMEMALIISFAIGFIYYFIFYVSFFKRRSFLFFIKTSFAFLLSNILYWIVLTAVMGIFVGREIARLETM